MCYLCPLSKESFIFFFWGGGGGNGVFDIPEYMSCLHADPKLQTEFKSKNGVLSITLGKEYSLSSRPVAKDFQVERDIDLLSRITEGGESAFEFNAENEAIKNHSKAVDVAAVRVSSLEISISLTLMFSTIQQRSLVETIALDDSSTFNGSSKDDRAQMAYARTAEILMLPERDKDKVKAKRFERESDQFSLFC